MDETDISNYIQKELSVYITPNMIQVIKDLNINKDVNEQDIREDYIKMMYDFAMLRINPDSFKE